MSQPLVGGLRGRICAAQSSWAIWKWVSSSRVALPMAMSWLLRLTRVRVSSAVLPMFVSGKASPSPIQSTTRL